MPHLLGHTCWATPAGPHLLRHTFFDEIELKKLVDEGAASVEQVDGPEKRKADIIEAVPRGASDVHVRVLAPTAMNSTGSVLLEV